MNVTLHDVFRFLMSNENSNKIAIIDDAHEIYQITQPIFCEKDDALLLKILPVSLIKKEENVPNS